MTFGFLSLGLLPLVRLLTVAALQPPPNNGQTTFI
jgi:hypothetical protein